MVGRFNDMTKNKLKGWLLRKLSRIIYCAVLSGVMFMAAFVFGIKPIYVGVALCPLWYAGLSEKEKEKAYKNETLFDKIVFYILAAAFVVCLLICIATAVVLLR